MEAAPAMVPHAAQPPRQSAVPDFARDVHCLLGLPVDAIDMGGALALVRRAARERRLCTFATPNLNFLVASHGDAAFRDAIIDCDLVVADGMPLVWAARLFGLPIRERVAGSSLFDALRAGDEPPLTVYFFGGPPGVAERAGQRLNASARGLVCAGFRTPGFGSVEEMSGDEIIAQINASGADILVVALGAKKGHAWIARNRARLTVPVASHLGAVVNFAAGTVARAPRWAQRGGLEWLWRIKEEPALWSRYWRDGLALLRLLVCNALPLAYSLRRARAATAPATLRVETVVDGDVIHLAGGWRRHDLAPLRRTFAAAAAAGRDLRLDLSQVQRVDLAFVGLLLLLRRHQEAQRLRLAIAGAPAAVRRVFKLSCADFMLSD